MVDFSSIPFSLCVSSLAYQLHYFLNHGVSLLLLCLSMAQAVCTFAQNLKVMFALFCVLWLVAEIFISMITRK